MPIQPVSLSIPTSGININPQKSINKPEFKNVQKLDVFQPSFKGFDRMLETVVNINFKKDKLVEEAFYVLYKQLLKEPDIIKKTGFAEISNLYKKSGFRGMMHELCKATPESNIAKIIEKAETEPQSLIAKNNKTLFEIFSISRKGFLDIIFNRKNVSKDTSLIFITPDEKFLMEFSLNEHGAYQICQKRRGQTVFTSFHNSTGNLESVTRQPHGVGNPETSYYNADGTSDTLKNYIQGGSVVNIW